jgi:hypothetical protein
MFGMRTTPEWRHADRTPLTRRWCAARLASSRCGVGSLGNSNTRDDEASGGLGALRSSPPILHLGAGVAGLAMLWRIILRAQRACSASGGHSAFLNAFLGCRRIRMVPSTLGRAKSRGVEAGNFVQYDQYADGRLRRGYKVR